MNNLAEVFKQWRWASKISVRQAAKRIGLVHSTYWRLEVGKKIDARHLAAAITWLLKEQ